MQTIRNAKFPRIIPPLRHALDHFLIQRECGCHTLLTLSLLRVPIRLEFNQRQVDTKIAWFQDDSNPSLNSNAYDIAGKIVNEFFPGDFGSEGLIRGVVDMILKRVSQFNSQLELQRNGSKKNEEIIVRNPYMETSTITSREYYYIVHCIGVNFVKTPRVPRQNYFVYY